MTTPPEPTPRGGQATLAALTTAYIAQQRLLSVGLVRDLVELLRTVFRPGDVDGSWRAVRRAAAAMIRDRRQLAGRLAGRYYLQVRGLSLAPRPGRLREPRLLPGMPGLDELAELAGLGDDATQIRRLAEEERREVLRLQERIERELQRDLDRAPDLAAATDAAGRRRGRARVEVAEPDEVPDERLEATLHATGLAVYRRALEAGRTEEQARDSMAVTMPGAAQMLVQEAARQVIRDTTESDREAIGWMRVSDGDPCSWCAMLISRGAVYKSAQTAGRAQASRFEGVSPFRWHNWCSCQAVPVFDADDPRLARAEALYDQWLEVTAGRSGKDAVNAWRRYWENREDRSAS